MTVRVTVDGQPHEVPAGLSVAALLVGLALPTRRSVSGAPRAPFCGMGLCGECEVAIDGQGRVLGCLTPCRDGLRIATTP